MKEKFVKAYMDTAHRFAQLSTAKRLQVGAIIVKDDRIISIGYNGMPSGWDNVCEHQVYANEFGREKSYTKTLSWRILYGIISRTFIRSVGRT